MGPQRAAFARACAPSVAISRVGIIDLNDVLIQYVADGRRKLPAGMRFSIGQHGDEVECGPAPEGVESINEISDSFKTKD